MASQGMRGACGPPLRAAPRVGLATRLRLGARRRRQLIARRASPPTRTPAGSPARRTDAFALDADRAAPVPMAKRPTFGGRRAPPPQRRYEGRSPARAPELARGWAPTHGATLPWPPWPSPRPRPGQFIRQRTNCAAHCPASRARLTLAARAIGHTSSSQTPARIFPACDMKPTSSRRLSGRRPNSRAFFESSTAATG